jgi:hypothetical protein
MIGTSRYRRPGVWLADESDRFLLEVVTTSGSAAVVEFRILLDTVEVHHAGHCCGALDRDFLRNWLAEPGRPLVVDEVAFSLDRMVDQQGRVALSLPDVMVWTLSPVVLAELQKRI